MEISPGLGYEAWTVSSDIQCGSKHLGRIEEVIAASLIFEFNANQNHWLTIVCRIIQTCIKRKNVTVIGGTA